MDHKAVDVIKSIEYDLSAIDNNLSERNCWNYLVRAKMFKDEVVDFIQENPHALIINLGAGLDTTFYAVDNGTIEWVDIDFPNVIETRKKLLPPNGRTTYIAKDVLDFSWMDEIKEHNKKTLLIACGLFLYLSEHHIKALLNKIMDTFSTAELVLDRISSYSLKYVKEAIEKSGLHQVTIQWHINDAKTIESWNNNIHILRELSMFSKIDRSLISNKEIVYVMDMNDKYKSTSVIHLKLY